MSEPSKFKVALIAMRTGVNPRANLDAVLAAVGEAKAAGADYVQTPEMTNIMEVKRERLFANIVADESDPTLATMREVARTRGIIIHLGSLAL